MINKYVSTYVNPDTDGVCSSITFQFINKEYVPIVFGIFDEETRYVLDYFKLPYPKVLDKIEGVYELVLVDTHHLNQIHHSVNPLFVTHIIDHHPAGDDKAFSNAKIQNEEVGSVCTLLSEYMQLNKIYPIDRIAGIMAMAIVSNTLNFSAPSTHARDVQSFNWLIKYFDYDKSFIKGMFGARSNYKEKITIEVLESNMKILEILNGIGISQVETVSPNDIINRDDLRQSVISIVNKNRLSHFVLSIVDIYNMITYVMVFDEETKFLLENSMLLKFDNMLSVVNRILLRKTDFFPKLKNYSNK